MKPKLTVRPYLRGHASKCPNIWTTHANWAPAHHVSLTIKSRKLWLILYEIILAILHDSLIIQMANSTHALSFGLSILVGILHFLFSLFHVTWTNWLDFAVQCATKNIFLILNIKAWSTTLAICWLFCCLILIWKVLIVVLIWLLIGSGALVIVIWIHLFICQVEACAVRHVHFEAAWSKALSLRLFYTCYFFFWVAHWAILLLRILLDQLVLEWLLIIMKLLTVTCYSWLTWIDWSLQSCNHIQ